MNIIVILLYGWKVSIKSNSKKLEIICGNVLSDFFIIVL